MARKTEGSFSDLFMDNSLSDEESLTTLRLSEIEPNKNQPRKSFDSDALKQLADSIVEHGVIQPLLVRSLPSGNYVIIAGERRWRASKMAGLSEIPVVIRDDITDEQAAQIAMIENLQRENLNPIEEALGYKEIIDKHGLTQDKLARALGKARSSIANSLGLLTMPNGVQELLRQGLLSAGHCKALKKVKDDALMTELAHKAANGELSVRQVEQIAKRESENAKVAEKSREIKPRLSYYTEVEASLTEQFGTKVRISEGKKGNVLQINFKDKEELENILAHFQEN
ncbi:MAG: ParB/RepB/Spo0J family partition protein [Ruminococcaceae bacterium]|nr:ParB/RepB/Spo0J family partition protein [Oscillospiraceae bacterium]